MARNYKRKLNLKVLYGTSSKEDIKKAIEDHSKGMSIRKAADKHKVKKSTLHDHIRKPTLKKFGGQTIISKADEVLIAQMLEAVADWGFPIGRLEVRIMAFNFLKNRNGLNSFNLQIPGNDWLNSFMKRNNISGRNASNIKQSRSKLGVEMISNFFDEFEKTYESLGDIQPSNVFNFDETNLSDDPGKKFVLVRRGRRRVENVQEHSKTSISLMWCGSASGVLQPPMVVYKASNVYKGWVTGGPQGTIYSCTKSGWFDMETFAKWFETCFLPNVQHLNGPKLLLGDNLASHFNLDVIKLAKEHNVYFAMLPPNATHLMQPLDVSVFGPMKRCWKHVLYEWRKQSRKTGCFPKEHFPALLKSLSIKLQETVCQNLVSGFITCGLYPINRIKVLKRIPEYKEPGASTASILNDSVTTLLMSHRGAYETKKPRGNKLNIASGEF
ncbi:jerky protein homolog-like [Hydra vulgaris]|uniref:Jerky protein homolog-like n=1 Tax=Hydra vulgaris TaxID=6087 RepID=A0ABM4BNG0_HYDVU